MYNMYIVYVGVCIILYIYSREARLHFLFMGMREPEKFGLGTAAIDHF